MTHKITYEYVENIVSSNARSTMSPRSSSVNLPRSIFLGQSSSFSSSSRRLSRRTLRRPLFWVGPKAPKGKFDMWAFFFLLGLNFFFSFVYLLIHLFICFFLSIITFISFPFYFILFYLSFSYICLFFILQTFCIIFLIWFRSRLQIQVYMIGEAAPEHQPERHSWGAANANASAGQL